MNRSTTHRLALLALALRVGFFFSYTPIALAATPTIQVTPITQSFSPQQFLVLTNEQRVEWGSAPLHLNDQLDTAALAKAEDMAQKGYWAHFRPGDGKAPWDFIDEAGYHYRVAGENLAKGYRTPVGITNAWMNSPAHRANLVSTKYTDVGFACIEAEMDGQKVLLTVQLFGAK